MPVACLSDPEAAGALQQEAPCTQPGIHTASADPAAGSACPDAHDAAPHIGKGAPAHGKS